MGSLQRERDFRWKDKETQKRVERSEERKTEELESQEQRGKVRVGRHE